MRGTWKLPRRGFSQIFFRDSTRLGGPFEKITVPKDSPSQLFPQFTRIGLASNQLTFLQMGREKEHEKKMGESSGTSREALLRVSHGSDPVEKTIEKKNELYPLAGP